MDCVFANKCLSQFELVHIIIMQCIYCKYNERVNGMSETICTKGVMPYSDREKWKDTVYELMSGDYDLENYPIEESRLITNEFEDGSFCERIYQEVYRARQRLYSRMGISQDEDVEQIMADMLLICRHLSLKMYDYGEKFAEKFHD